MHGLEGEEWKQRRHMLPVPASATTVGSAADSPSTEFVCQDGRKILVGDCALFKPPDDSPPFIGIIRKLTSNKEESLSLEVNWLYRPADLKLAKGILLEAAPNEVFYSFHKDETPAQSLLHPCKVAFLRRGVELPTGISAFVCRRVYDIENKCLWWLTDKDYLNERQEEVNQLLDKTRLEMHGEVQSGGRSPKPLDGPTSTSSVKSSPDSAQNSPFGSQGKGKKRERGDHGSDSSKRERLTKTEDGDSDQFRPEIILKSEIAKITDKGRLVDFEGVERLVQLMQPDRTDKKLDLAGRIMLVDVIAVTDKFDCLGWFVQLRGLPVLDEWLQEVHKGKIGDGSMPKESDKSVEEFLLALLRALDKLPVNLHALQTCNVGKSVNNLRSHKNSEIQKKARSLVDTWKKRVEAEMNKNDAKSGSTRGLSWPAKPAPPDVSHIGNRKTGGSAEVVVRCSAMQTIASKSSQAKLSAGEALSKFSQSPGSTKSMNASVGSNSKEQNVKILVGAGASDLPLTPIKEERSSSSSQSQNNSLSCLSEHAKTFGFCKEDARSSTAVSMSASKTSGGASRSRKSSNGLLGSAVIVVQNESNSGKNSNRNSPSESVSPTQVSHDKLLDIPLVDQGNNQQLIVRLPNAACSPARGASGGSSEDPVIAYGNASPPADTNENQDRSMKSKLDGLQANIESNMTTDLCEANEVLTGCEEDNDSPTGDECFKAVEDDNKVAETSKPSSLSGGQIYDASLNSINALIESCVKISEASTSVSPGDDVGMNLLATVAAGEMSRSENVSPLASPKGKSPGADESVSGNDGKSKHSGEAIVCTLGQSDGGSVGEHVNTVDPLQFKNVPRHLVAPMSCDFFVDGEATSSGFIEKTGEGSRPETEENVSETILSAQKETVANSEGLDQFHEQRELGMQWDKCTISSDSQLKARTPSFDEDRKVDLVDEGIMEKDKVLVSEGAEAIVMNKKEANETLPEPSSDLGMENDINAEKATGNGNFVQKPSPVVENCKSVEGKDEDVVLPFDSGSALMESKAEHAKDLKPVEIEHNERRLDLDSSLLNGIDGCIEENMDIEEVLGQCSGSSVHSESPKIPVQENEVCKKYSGRNLDRIESEGGREWHASSANALLTVAGSDTAVKLDFDLNEGFPVDDVSQGEILRQEEPCASSAVHMPCSLPFLVSSAAITVASAAKGAVVPPENPLWNKGELGWKGSAATSAFRPAEPRKNAELQSNTSNLSSVDATSTKQVRAPLDFDLNVPNERSFEDVAFHGSCGKTCGSAGLDLDLNRVDETPDAGSFSVSKLDIPFLPNKPSFSGGLSNGGSISRDFDLNNGPGLDEVTTEAPAHSQHKKCTVPFPSVFHGLRTNNVESGNYSSWFPSVNSYTAITVPPLVPSRGEQNYVAGAGTQRILGPAGSTAFGPEMFRGPVLSSSPAVAYPPTTRFPYPGFPFETSFQLSSNSFSGSSTPFMDSSTAGGLCFPSMPSQLVGPGAVVSSTYPCPYVMSLPGVTSNVISESRKWGSQSLDLNSGPGGTDSEQRDDRLPSGLRQLSVPNSQALMEEQMKMFQMAGGVWKRKEPDGGWDGADKFSYKQPSWQ